MQCTDCCVMSDMEMMQCVVRCGGVMRCGIWCGVKYATMLNVGVVWNSCVMWDGARCGLWLCDVEHVVCSNVMCNVVQWWRDVEWCGVEWCDVKGGVM